MSPVPCTILTHSPTFTSGEARAPGFGNAAEGRDAEVVHPLGAAGAVPNDPVQGGWLEGVQFLMIRCKVGGDGDGDGDGWVGGKKAHTLPTD